MKIIPRRLGRPNRNNGCDYGFRRSDGLGPVGFPLVVVQQGTEAGHSVSTLDPPASPGLLQPAADEVLTRTLDLSAANRTPLR